MSRYFTHYWDNTTWDNERARGDEGTLMTAFYGNQFTARKMQAGDVVYAVTVRQGHLFVLCRIEVARIESARDSQDRWRERVEVRAGTATPRHFDNRVPADVLRRLRFISADGTSELRLSADGTLDHMAMRMMRELTPGTAALLDNIIHEYKGGLPSLMPSSHQDAGGTFEQEERPAATASVWMFQYSPHNFNLEHTLTKRQVEDWTAYWQRAAIQSEQLAYIFRSGKHAGIVAIGHLATGLYERPSKERYLRYWVDIAFDALVTPMLSRADILRDPLLCDFRPYAKGAQRSNVLLPPEVAARTAELVAERLGPLPLYAGPAADNAHWARVAAEAEAAGGGFDPTSILDARRHTFRSIVQRQGQPRFRDALLDAYGGRCAITGCDIVEVLEAAHITPYRGPETNHPTNGLLLRADLHTLFDWGLIAIDTTAMTLLVAPRLMGTTYASLAGTELRQPKDTVCQPSIAALDQHRTWAQLGRS